MKKILLTQGKVVLVDDEDFERLNQVKWCAMKGRNTFYAVRNSSTVNGKRHLIYMHHEIIGKPPIRFKTDHRDGNGLNNQRNNLRHITSRQNCQNRINITKSSQYPGVYWFKQYKKWAARIRINGIKKHLGYFMNEFDAFNAYRQAVEAIGEEVIR